MRLVIDANILVAELIRQRGRELILHPIWELYMPEKQWKERLVLFKSTRYIKIQVMTKRLTMNQKLIDS